MGGVIRDSLIDQEVNRTILTTFNGDRSAFLKNLSLSGMTIRAFREMTKKQLQVQIMRASKYDQEIPPTPEEIQQEYEATKEQYRDLTKDKIKFKKIFIPMLGDDSASTPEVQLNLAELIAKEIKSKNATFEDMAKRYSKDLYAEKGGDWPVTERSTLSRNPPPSSLARSPAKSSGRWWTPPASPSCWWKKRNWPLLRHFPPSRSRST
ncbi:MAG: peptidylprolyl isomerase [Akkermansia sp.]